MKRRKYITATELAECTVCEQRVLLDQQRGRRRTADCRKRMLAGTEAHASLHRAAMYEVKGGGRPASDGDPRCFVATALWGPDDPRTSLLRGWRDEILLGHRIGRIVVAMYYAVSPSLVRAIDRLPVMKAPIERGLDALTRRIAQRGP